MTLGQGVRLAIQAAYFTVIARSLGVSGYGAFVGVVALVGMLYPFAAAGRGNLLIQQVARDRSLFPRMWGAALATTTVCGSILIGLIVAIAHFALPRAIPTQLVTLVALSDILGQNVILLAGQAFQSQERLGWTALLNVLMSASRLAAALALVALHPAPSTLQWGYAYFTSTAFVAVLALWLVARKLRAPQFNLPRSFGEIRSGLYFSVSLSAQTIYNDLDKTMLARLSTLSATGVYGAAYRIIDVSFAPVSALLYAAYPRFFREGSSGVTSALAYARRLIGRAIAYASAVALLLLLASGAVPLVLGPGYRDTAEAIRWLAILPILKAIHYFLSDALSGAGHQAIRCGIQAAVAIFNALINLWLIPAYSWRGAAWSSIASDGLLAAAIAVCALLLDRQEKATAVLKQTSLA
jgi:O-antigen/teichoic acid export membrane protein